MNASAAIGVPCPTRWTVKADPHETIINNYSVLQSTWTEALDLVNDNETKAELLEFLHR